MASDLLTLLLVPMVIISEKTPDEGQRWEPLDIGIIRPKQLLQLAAPIMDGLRDAIVQMRSLISVRQFLGNDNQLSSRTLTSCIPHWNISTAACFMETPNSGQKLHPFNITKDVDLRHFGVNFLLFVQVEIQKCHADVGLLAAAAPCALIGQNRPAAGQLLLCPSEDHRWNAFQAMVDLFRHEILHALGFGLIIPSESSTLTAQKVWWTVENGRQLVTVSYMDFQDQALAVARNHFGCQNLLGIEADNDDKIHLSEYLYGDELMTPVLSNRRNYFTKISASILEATKHGESQWYKTNESMVLAETEAYWYGRNWGCVFAERSCYEYIVDRIENENSTFPFCDAFDLLKTRGQYLKTKFACFSNGTMSVMVPLSCNVLSYIRNFKTASGLRARTLAHHFKELRQTKLANLYGSDGIHRFCPFVQEVLYDRMEGIPVDAEIVDCYSGINEI